MKRKAKEVLREPMMAQELMGAQELMVAREHLQRPIPLSLLVSMRH